MNYNKKSPSIYNPVPKGLSSHTVLQIRSQVCALQAVCHSQLTFTAKLDTKQIKTYVVYVRVTIQTPKPNHRTTVLTEVLEPNANILR